MTVLTVLTVAIASALLDGGPYLDPLLELGRRYPHASYGRTFRAWLRSADNQPYNSWANGSAMLDHSRGVLSQVSMEPLNARPCTTWPRRVCAGGLEK